ncbi:hypothetical protein POJ06DRAFT_302458 [Lipomyces tetrasporus]|uniref:Uncharacterized protein n=1 Tax=Lipomyces tetrasporus TaxID=54092 RepID=A0AAD7QNE8_9ASCO|nr:uncharacterized protein POJ06DRAFT_302458 [Lipomyces tetrasporus]KAJ8098525.1 hypothetical protein POJ06DRAFT_302458 [Lipomyces tetrasporus]
MQLQAQHGGAGLPGIAGNGAFSSITPPTTDIQPSRSIKSTTGGARWSEYSRVQSTVNRWGLRYQPVLYALAKGFGGYPAATILISGPSVPSHSSEAYIEVYAKY